MSSIRGKLGSSFRILDSKLSEIWQDQWSVVWVGVWITVDEQREWFCQTYDRTMTIDLLLEEQSTLAFHSLSHS